MKTRIEVQLDLFEELAKQNMSYEEYLMQQRENFRITVLAAKHSKRILLAKSATLI